mmetsp:Transcript_54966/g.97907  ORF Transcript_54966/g.97907 Transcript_54966/m.97907 type:complete len:93 (-) Transcript_54966:736-1014(-)
MHGAGKMTYANGNVYEGDWKADKRHGKGVVHYPTGDILQGQWVDGLRHGECYIIYSTGRKHVAEFENDQLKEGSLKFLEVVEMPKRPGEAPG